jgi:hypothetical protein
MATTSARALGILGVLAVGCASPSAHDEPAGANAQSITTSNGAPPNFAQVKDGLYRGGHPDRAALEYLKGIGVTSILSLQEPEGSVIEGDKADEIAEERADAADLGLSYASVPMSSWSRSETYDQNWDDVRPMLDKPSGLFVHCEHGKDRTGLVIALERVAVEGWTPDAAHHEMVELGHSSLLVMIDRYFWSKTGGGGGDDDD